MTESLVHYAAKPVTKLQLVTQISIPFFKPHGLWLSVEGNGDGWKDWCEGEKFNLSALSYAHDVVLSPKANILRLSKADDIYSFGSEFPANESNSFRMHIDWPAVARKYQGIIIAPYIWEVRLEPSAGWYYAWDCASGCVWDVAAIESITLRAAAP